MRVPNRSATVSAMAPLRLRPPLRRATFAAGAAALALAASAADAGATAVSYVDGDEVWVASLDGTRKARLPDPGVLGPGRWQQTAMADGGRLVAQRREGNSMFTSFALWDPSGRLLNASALPYEPGWTLYLAPLGLDLTADGVSLVYGYSNSRGIFPTASYESGFYAINAEATRTLLTPFKQSGAKWPTVAGARVLATDGNTQVSVQDAAGQPPYVQQFTPWLNVAGGWEVSRADAAANASAVGVELTRWSGGERTEARILMVRTPNGLGGTIGDDCYLPSSGLASDVSISQDGTRVAWRDAGGVKVAGIPAFDGPETCRLTAPPVVISPTGASPSIGGFDLAALTGGSGGGGIGGGSGGAGGGGAGGTGGAGSGGSGSGSGAGGGRAGAGNGAALRLTAPARARAAALATGLRLTVVAPRAGTVTVTGRVPANLLRRGARGTTVVLRGSARVRSAGRATVTVKPTAAAKGKLRRLAGHRLALTATLGTATTRTRLWLR